MGVAVGVGVGVGVDVGVDVGVGVGVGTRLSLATCSAGLGVTEATVGRLALVWLGTFANDTPHVRSERARPPTRTAFSGFTLQ